MTEQQAEILLKFCKYLENNLQKHIYDLKEILSVITNDENEYEKVISEIIYLKDKGYFECNMRHYKGAQIAATLKLTTKAIDFANQNQG